MPSDDDEKETAVKIIKLSLSTESMKATDYTNWLTAIKVYLQLKHCSGALSDNSPRRAAAGESQTNYAGRRDRSTKAFAIMWQNLELSLQEHIKSVAGVAIFPAAPGSFMVANELLNWLDHNFAIVNSEERRQMAIHQFEAMQFDPSIEPSSSKYVMKYKAMYDELVIANHPMSLPPLLNTLIDQLVNQTDNLTGNNWESRMDIIKGYQHLPAGSPLRIHDFNTLYNQLYTFESRDASSLMRKRQAPGGSKKAIKGSAHLTTDTRFGSGSSSTSGKPKFDSSKVECFECGRVGHIRRHCEVYTERMKQEKEKRRKRGNQKERSPTRSDRGSDDDDDRHRKRSKSEGKPRFGDLEKDRKRRSHSADDQRRGRNDEKRHKNSKDGRRRGADAPTIDDASRDTDIQGIPLLIQPLKMDRPSDLIGRPKPHENKDGIDVADMLPVNPSLDEFEREHGQNMLAIPSAADECGFSASLSGIEDNSLVKKSSNKVIIFLCDSCAYPHIVNNKSWLSNVKEVKGLVKLADKSEMNMDYTLIGDLVGITNKGVKLTLTPVLFCPTSRNNLLSTGTLLRSGISFLHDKRPTLRNQKSGMVIAEMHNTAKDFAALKLTRPGDDKIDGATAFIAHSHLEQSEIRLLELQEKWHELHESLGHCSTKKMRIVLQDAKGYGIPQILASKLLLLRDIRPCIVCSCGKTFKMQGRRLKSKKSDD